MALESFKVESQSGVFSLFWFRAEWIGNPVMVMLVLCLDLNVLRTRGTEYVSCRW
jgi:hypothetical protein